MDQDTGGNVVPAPSPPTITRRRRLIAMLVTMTGVIVIGLAVLEVIFRVFVPVTDVPFMFWDPVVGLRRGPNQHGRLISGNYVNGEYNINSQGWNHHKDYTTVKAPNALRVCLVGDSQVEATQVDLDQRMNYIAEQAMSRPDRPVEWNTFGVSGLGTSQQYEIIRHYALDYQPDLVILLYIQNDPFDCSPYIMPLERFTPIYYLDEDDELRLAPAKQWHPVWYRRLSARSALVRYLVIQRKVLLRIQYWGKLERADVRLGGLPLREEVEAVEHAYIPGLEGMTMEARQARTWELTARLLSAARDECARRGARFAVAFRGWAAEIDAPLGGTEEPLPPKKEDPYCLGSRAREMGREIIGPMCQRLDIPYLDLTASIQAEVATSGRAHRFPDDNHFNDVGHRAAGRALAEWAESLLSQEQTAPAAQAGSD